MMKLATGVLASAALVQTGLGAVWINEMHVNTVGGDTGEFIEVAVTAKDAALVDKLTVHLVEGSGSSEGQLESKSFKLSEAKDSSTSNGVTFYHLTEGVSNSLENTFYGFFILNTETNEILDSVAFGNSNLVGVEEPILGYKFRNYLGRDPELQLGNSFSLTDNGWVEVTATPGAINTNQTLSNTKLRVVHMNDMHGRVDGMTYREGTCKDITGEFCDGGWPRIFTAARGLVSETTDPVIFVEDGDELSGTIWSAYYKGKEAYTFLNSLCGSADGAGFAACVATFGNHEFDYGYETLVNYTDNLDLPVVSSNIIDSCNTTNTLAEKMEKNRIITLPNGRRVGIVAYTTTDTAFLSSAPKCVTFQNEVAAAEAEIEDLKAQGVNVIIAVGHAGYNRDVQIAEALQGKVDFIVGGHSHSFLWDTENVGAVPSMSGGSFGGDVKGAYPTSAVSGKTAIVQSYYGGIWLGAIDLEFDIEGELVGYSPKLTLVGSDIQNITSGDKTSINKAPKEFQFAPDAVATALVEELRVPLAAEMNRVVAVSDVDFPRGKERLEETKLGNIICDSMMHAININTPSFTEKFGEVSICMMNGGGIRAPIEKGDVTVGEIIEVLPFGNVMSVLELTGEQIYKMLENSASGFPGQGRFAQLAGLSYDFDPSVEPGCSPDKTACVGNVEIKRVKAAFVNGELVPMDASKKYIMVTNNYVAGGGDGYSVLSEEAEMLFPTGPALDTAFIDYLNFLNERDGTVDVAISCRINNLETPCRDATTPVCSDKGGLLNEADGQPVSCDTVKAACAVSPVVRNRCQNTCKMCGEEVCADKAPSGIKFTDGKVAVCSEIASYCSESFVQNACPTTCKSCSDAESRFIDVAEILALVDSVKVTDLNPAGEKEVEEDSSPVGAIVGSIFGVIALGAVIFFISKQINRSGSEDEVESKVAVSNPQYEKDMA